MSLIILFIICIVIVGLVAKFNPTVHINEEGTFLQYTIKGKLGGKETVIKKIS